MMCFMYYADVCIELFKEFNSRKIYSMHASKQTFLTLKLAIVNGNHFLTFIKMLSQFQRVSVHYTL